MLSFLHEFVPIVVMVLLAELAVRSARAFFAAERARAFVVVARVPSWVLAVVMTIITAQYAFAILPVGPSDLFNTWMAAALMLAVARIVLTWAYALMILGMHILMATNYMRVPSGRRQGIVLLITGVGAVVMASGAMIVTVHDDMGLRVIVPLGALLMIVAWVIDRRTVSET